MIGREQTQKRPTATMLELFLLRHGEAEARAAHDSQRRLTQQGEAEIGRAAQKLPTQLSGLIHSPYVRTQQSAQLVLQHSQAEQVISADWITPDAAVSDAIDQLQALEGTWLLVTHNPFVSYLAAQLSAISVNQTSFSTGSLALLAGAQALPGTLSFAWK